MEGVLLAILRTIVDYIGYAATRELLDQCKAVEANHEAEEAERKKFGPVA